MGLRFIYSIRKSDGNEIGILIDMFSQSIPMKN